MGKYFVYRTGQKQATLFKSFKKACDFASEQMYCEEDMMYIDECLSHGVYPLAYMLRRDKTNHLVSQTLGQYPAD